MRLVAPGVDAPTEPWSFWLSVRRWFVEVLAPAQVHQVVT